MPSSSTDDLLRTSRIMLMGGSCFLPLLWIVHLLYHVPLYRQPEYQVLQPKLKTHLLLAGCGTLIWTCLFVGWFITFIYTRDALVWIGDQLTVVIPKGK